MKATNYIASAALAATLGLWGASADAFTWGSCSDYVPDASSRLTASDGCNLNTNLKNNGEPVTSNPSTADFDGLFGVDDWVEIAKENSSTGGAGLDANGVKFTSKDNNFSGTWSITQALLDQYAIVAIVMKDGNQAPKPTIAYEISTTQGTWLTPWVNDPTKGYTQDNLNAALSNVRFIGQGVGVIPLPAGAWLMIAAFGGLGAAARYKKQSSTV